MSKTTFFEIQKEIFHLFKNKKFAEVHYFINLAEEKFPERIEKLSFWRACAYCNQGENNKAIQAFQKALEKGVWWNPYILTRDPDLVPLQNMDEFLNIIYQCQEILQNQQANSHPKLYTFGNSNAEIGIFSLHWRGSTVDDFAPYWLDQQNVQKYHFAFPQSSQPFSYNAYCWDDQEIARKDIVRTFREFNQLTHAKKMILAGASQGGKLAIEFSITNELYINGFIAVIPSIQNVELIEKQLQSNRVDNVKGCVITGDQDPFYHKALGLQQIFEAHGILCKWIVLKGLDHSFPHDFPQYLEEAIDYITN